MAECYHDNGETSWEAESRGKKSDKNEYAVLPPENPESTSAHENVDTCACMSGIYAEIEAAMPALPTNAKKWLAENFYTFSSSDELITEFQRFSILQNQTSDLMKLWTKLMLSNKISETASELYQHLVSRVKCDEDTAQWICDNLPANDSIEDFLENEKLECLRYKQIKTLKEILHNSARLLKPDNFTADVKVSQGEVAQRLEAKTYPLITCRDLIQDTGVVEKFLIREEYVQSLCNLIGSPDVFYTDISGGININFEELEGFKLNLIGVLGKLHRAKDFFQQLLSEKSFEEFLLFIEKEGSGMYLIIASDLKRDCGTNFYLYFHSKNDEDYQYMNPKSRAVHFIRYMTQLCGNMLLLLDETDEKILCEKQPDLNTRERANIFVIKQQQMGLEQVIAKKCGKVDTPGKGKDLIQLYGSDNGLFAVKTKIKEAQEILVKRKTVVTAKNFPLQFQLETIKELSKVDWCFMKDYLKVFDKAEFEQIETSLDGEKKKLLQEREGSRFGITQDIAVGLELCKAVDPTTFFIMCEFFSTEEVCESSDDAKLWNESRNLKIDLTKAFTEKEIKELKKSLSETFKDSSEILPTILLRFGLNTDKENFEDLFHLAWEQGNFETVVLLKNFHIPRFSGEKPNPNDGIVHTFYKKLIGGIVSKPSEARLTFEKALHKQFDVLKFFSANVLGDTRSVPLAKYPQYRHSVYNKHVTKYVDQSRKDKIIGRFKEIILLCEQIGKESNRKIEPLIKIISIDKSSVPLINQANYSVTYEQTEKLAAKKILKLYRLCFHTGYSQFRHDVLSDPPKSENMVFKSVCSIELLYAEILVIFTVDESLALIVANKDGSSFFVVYNTYLSQHTHSATFRRPISHCDFSSRKRLLCLYSQGAEVAELITYQFAPDFKTHAQYSRIDVQEKHNLLTILSMKIQNNSDYIWILDGYGNRVLKFNIKNGSLASPTEEAKVLQGVMSSENVVHLDISPNGDCVFLQTQEGITLAFMTHSLTVLNNCPCETRYQKLFYFPETNQTFSFASSEKSAADLYLLVINSSKREMRLHEQATANDSESQINSQPTYKKVHQKKHWIHNLYCVFVKFPCHNNWLVNSSSLKFSAMMPNASEKFKNSIREAFKDIFVLLKNTRKPVTLFQPQVTLLNATDGCYLILTENGIETGAVNLGRFLIKLISFTPVQIARCQNKSFVVLRDGEPLSTENVQDVFEMKNKISLGLYEAIFRNWTGSVKVISSMGKQTTGKSYLLNHLTNSSFNISGARCTDGCWMTISMPPSSDSLFVILDFEGLGSFERSDQDDMLLSLLSSALSNITLFKTEKRLDRSTDELFSKFSLASDQLRGTDSIFKGSFAIIVNDVSETDMDDVKMEFVEKINSIVRAQEENNFLSKLYRGGFQIRPFSPFQTDHFYEDVEALRKYLANSRSEFIGGNAFMEIMKLLMAKLTFNDFSPFNRLQVDSRVKYLRNHLQAAITFGQLNLEPVEDVDCSLTILDQKNAKIDTKWIFKMDVGDQETVIDDLTNRFTDEGFSDLVFSFTQLLPLFSVDLLSWRLNLEKFVSFCVEKRLDRVKVWLTKNTDLWKNCQEQDFLDSIGSLFDFFELEQKTLLQNMKLCNEKCFYCFFKCSQKLNHEMDHSCNTSHRCPEVCDFCKDKQTTCTELLGHIGEHFCWEGGHTCGQPCQFSEKNNCANLCMKNPNHDNEHNCYLLMHTCNFECSRPDCYTRCAIDINLPHTVHKCPKTHCVRKCSVAGCNNICVAEDHFHGVGRLRIAYQWENGIEKSSRPFTDKNGMKFFSAQHFCGNEHLCPKNCEQKGHCILSMERFEQDLYVGRRSQFPYSKKMVSVGLKISCLKKIPPFELDHDGQHSCTLNTAKKVHYCEKICPQCENICNKPYNHENDSDDVLHRTSHGNMINMIFVSTSATFEYQQHELEAGESAKMDYCHVRCYSKGRGHTHLTVCPGECDKKFIPKQDHRRHDPKKWLPEDGRLEYDEIWHTDYWKLLKFEDPCKNSENMGFEKCNYYCSHQGHDENSKSYCILDLWHDSVNTLKEAGLRTGVVANGHVFLCKH